MPKRILGKTGEQLSIIGFGGIMLNDNPQDFANEIVAKAFKLGVNYFDVSPLYGNSENKLGQALNPFRKNCFLACKTRERDAKGAKQNLENSLKNLQTDYFDLYQLHELSSVEEVEQAFSSGGAMETLVKAKQDGKIKHIGFSAHSVDAALLAMKNFDFDSILFPINFACWNAGNFGPQVFAEAEKRGMGILALKSMALTTFHEKEDLIFKNCWYRPISDEEIMKIALKYTLSKNITAAIPPGDYSLFLKALEFMNDYEPISENETKELLLLAKNTKPIFIHK
ncbi:MAG: aldo/keto reductase [Draconibacterium sp.]|nr:aldo/keto reductase [Draconibacterium sp.]